MKLVVTLQDPLLTEGGTIVVVPRSVSQTELKLAEVEVSARLSFVYFDYDANDRWTLHFDRAPAEVDKSRSTRFKLMTVGSADYEDGRGHHVTLAQYNVFHVSGRLASEQESQAIGNDFLEQIKEADGHCRSFGDHAKVCVPSVSVGKR